MLRISLFAIGLVLVIGCGKKNAALTEGDGNAVPPDDPATIARAQLRGRLIATKGDARLAAIDAAASQAATDHATLDMLVDLLKDKGNAGSGKTHPSQITSSREAAALALVKAGPNGQAALTAKGFPLLAAGLADPDAAVREHTAHALGKLGPLAKPLSPAVQKLIADPDAKVREAAAAAVRDIGVTDVAGLAALLSNPDPAARRLAAGLIASLETIPPEAIGPIAAALADDDVQVRAAAANALAVAGPAAGSDAAEKLADALAKTYPETYDAEAGWEEGLELTYWQALVRIGEPAAAPLARLLGHPNVLVRFLAARALGEIGAAAKAAAPTLRKHLLDGKEDGSVRIEAACALCRIGENASESLKLIEAALASPAARYAIDAIPRLGPLGEKLVPLALEQIGSNDPYVRLAVVQLAAALDPEAAAKAVPALAKLVDDAEPVIRRQMALVLVKLGPAAAPAAAAIARVLLAENDLAVKEEYVEALIAMGPGAKPAAAALIQLYDNPDISPAMRRRVLVAAAVADPASAAVAAVLVKAAADKDEYTRAAAAAALGKLDPLPPDALQALLKLAQTDSLHVVRAAAVRALAEAGPRAKPARAELESLSNNASPGVRLWAKVAIAAVDGDVQSAAGAVRAALADPDLMMRIAAAECLLLLGPTPADLPPLMALLKEPVAREAAVRAIGRLGAAAKEAVPPLAELLDDRDSRVRIAAAEALGQIGAPAALSAIPKLREVLRDPLVASAARRSLELLGVKADSVRGPKRQ